MQGDMKADFSRGRYGCYVGDGVVGVWFWGTMIRQLY